MTTSTYSEHALIEGLKRGDPSAFKQLMTEYKNRVANICYRFLFDRQDAEETAQEVFISIYKNIHNFKGQSKLSTWIYQLAASKSIDLIRSRKRLKRAAKITSIFTLREQGCEIPDNQNMTPEDKLGEEEKGRIIREAINTLPHRHREAFTLSQCRDIGHVEVADIMGVSRASVDLLVHRAKKKLKTILYKAFEKELEKKSKKLKKNPKANVTKNEVTLLIISLLYRLVSIVFQGKG